MLTLKAYPNSTHSPISSGQPALTHLLLRPLDLASAIPLLGHIRVGVLAVQLILVLTAKSNGQSIISFSGKSAAEGAAPSPPPAHPPPSPGPWALSCGTPPCVCQSRTDTEKGHCFGSNPAVRAP